MYDRWPSTRVAEGSAGALKQPSLAPTRGLAAYCLSVTHGFLARQIGRWAPRISMGSPDEAGFRQAQALAS